jgi:hypothetical protein
MQTEYKATLNNGRVEWNGTPPPPYLNGAELVVTVARPENYSEMSKEERGRGMAEALRELSKLNTFRDIADPVAWQREIREDRPLPGRE